MPASAWRTTPTPSARAGIVRRTSGATAAPLIPAPRRARSRSPAARSLTTGSTGTRPVMSRMRCTPWLDLLAHTDHVPLIGVQCTAARVEQRAEHGRVDERRRRSGRRRPRRRARAPPPAARAAWARCRCRALPRRPRPPRRRPIRRGRSGSHPLRHAEYPKRPPPVTSVTHDRPPGRLPLQARLRRDARARARRGGRGGGAAALRRARAPRPPPALGPAARARRRARLVGRPEGHPARPEAQPPRGAHRGPPARVHRLRGRDPGGPVRRRR